MKTIWMVEDHAAFRRTLAAVFNAEPELCCPKTFDSCESMLAAIQETKPPDVLLLDVGLPGISGIEGIREVKALHPNLLVLILTVFDDDEKVFRAICAGACGYLLKTAAAAEIVKAVEDALAGGSPMNPRVARRVLAMFNQFAPRKDGPQLSDRETEILQLMVSGLIKKEIADRLTLSVHTVDTYIRRIYEKLEVNTRTDAVTKAIKQGLV